MEDPHQRGIGQARLFVGPRSHAHGSTHTRASRGRRVSGAVRWLVVLLLTFAGAFALQLGSPAMATVAIDHGYDVDASATTPADTSQASRDDGRCEIAAGYAPPPNLSRGRSARDALTRAPQAGGGADDALGAGARALPRGTPELTQQRLEHIVGRHWATSGASRAGKFAPGTSGRDLRGLIDETARSGAVRPNTGGRAGQIFEQSFGRQIGTSSAGQASSQLRVVVGPDGKVITAFPY